MTIALGINTYVIIISLRSIKFLGYLQRKKLSFVAQLHFMWLMCSFTILPIFTEYALSRNYHLFLLLIVWHRINFFCLHQISFCTFILFSLWNWGAWDHEGQGQPGTWGTQISHQNEVLGLNLGFTIIGARTLSRGLGCHPWKILKMLYANWCILKIRNINLDCM